MGSPSRNVQYHPPRLSEDRLNLPQPHSPSLPTHCSGKSGMRPIRSSAIGYQLFPSLHVRRPAWRVLSEVAWPANGAEIRSVERRTAIHDTANVMNFQSARSAAKCAAVPVAFQHESPNTRPSNRAVDLTACPTGHVSIVSCESTRLTLASITLARRRLRPCARQALHAASWIPRRPPASERTKRRRVRGYSSRPSGYGRTILRLSRG